MREISSAQITAAVAELCGEANFTLGSDIYSCLNECRLREASELGQNILERIVENADIARTERTPICQDTGMAVFFIELGQDVHIAGGLLTDAVNEGVRQGYEHFLLRKSIVSDPLSRVNTRDNTPAVIHLSLTAGDKIKITFAPKGFGSENMSALKMLKPSDGEDGVKDFIVDTVAAAGSNPCPPIVVGVGIGGTMEMAAILAKKALTLPIDTQNAIDSYAKMESDLLSRINRLGIGPQGLGGTTTALGVNILTYPTHIAGLPVAVNISCHVTRHKEILI
ncbi:MAG: fumarate hydratase [Clostridia bacterium]|nr:fumarate hydratase [Clostridia bacterium]